MGREKSGPLDRDGSSDPYRTEIELALSKTLEIHPEAVQVRHLPIPYLLPPCRTYTLLAAHRCSLVGMLLLVLEWLKELAANLERAGIAGPHLNVVDFLFVFSRVVKRSKRLRRLFLISQDGDSTPPQPVSSTKAALHPVQPGTAQAGGAAMHGAAAGASDRVLGEEGEEGEGEPAFECLARDPSGSGTWRGLDQDEDDEEEEEEDEGKEQQQSKHEGEVKEEEREGEGKDGRADGHSCTPRDEEAGKAGEARSAAMTSIMDEAWRSTGGSSKSLPPSLDELFRHYSQ